MELTHGSVLSPLLALYQSPRPILDPRTTSGRKPLERLTNGMHIILGAMPSSTVASLHEVWCHAGPTVGSCGPWCYPSTMAATTCTSQGPSNHLVEDACCRHFFRRHLSPCSRGFSFPFANTCGSSGPLAMVWTSVAGLRVSSTDNSFIPPSPVISSENSLVKWGA